MLICWKFYHLSLDNLIVKLILKESFPVNIATCWTGLQFLITIQGRRHRGRGTGGDDTLTFLLSKKKKGKQRKKWNSFKAETIKRLSPRSKCYCFSHSTASKIQKIFLVSQPWCPTILFSVLWPLHFENHFTGPGTTTIKFSSVKIW